jgi:hypothetical protein
MKLVNQIDAWISSAGQPKFLCQSAMETKTGIQNFIATDHW